MQPNNNIYAYTLSQAVQDGVLKVIGRAEGKPTVVTRAISQNMSVPECLERFLSYFRWKADIAPTLPEEERLYSQRASDGQTLWVIEDGQAITLLYPNDY